jgi:hypothetical protein
MHPFPLWWRQLDKIQLFLVEVAYGLALLGWEHSKLSLIRINGDRSAGLSDNPD